MLTRGFEFLARDLRFCEEVLGVRGSLLEERKLARERAARSLCLTPQGDTPHHGEDGSDAYDRESGNERVQDHFAAIVPVPSLGSSPE